MVYWEWPEAPNWERALIASIITNEGAVVFNTINLSYYCD